MFFDKVKVPLENLVGEEHRGWDCAKFLLGNERTGSPASASPSSGYNGSRNWPKVTAGDRPLMKMSVSARRWPP